MAVFVAPQALAADEPSEVHAILEAGTSQATALRAWEPRQSFSVSLLRLGEMGQGFGARLTLLPPPSFTGTRELSADAVVRLTNEGPFYLKPVGGLTVALPGALWPPRIRAGAEVGLTAIRGGIGIEVGLAAVYSFPPSKALEGEWVVSAGVGVLFGFGSSSSAPMAAHRDGQAGKQLLSSANPVMGTVLRATPMGGGFNTCEGSKATPQCLQALSESEGTASTSNTSPPTTGTTARTAAPAEGATSSSSPGTVPSAAPRSPSLWESIAAAVGSALGFRSDEERVREAEHARLMRESERTLEKLRREAHERSPGTEAAKGVKPDAAAQADKDREEKKLGRIYVTYTKFNLRTNRYYVGRTSMVVDVTKSLLRQARAAVSARDLNHHIDENDEPKEPTFEEAELDQFDIGTAVNYERRHFDVAYWRIRGREQQLIDFHGGAQSDTGRPYRTENAVRGVARDNPRGRLYHDAATAAWGQLHHYTGK